tara:strand:- start:45 stop:413 length:369 start_codon:yes stop_codon:yes gene_type:complete
MEEMVIMVLLVVILVNILAVVVVELLQLVQMELYNVVETVELEELLVSTAHQLQEQGVEEEIIIVLVHRDLVVLVVEEMEHEEILQVVLVMVEQEQLTLVVEEVEQIVDQDQMLVELAVQEL